MTKRAAISQARQESTIYRQGSGWIFSRWSDRYQLNEVSQEMPYHCARILRRRWIEERVKTLLEVE